MEETDENMSVEEINKIDSPASVKVKPKKRSLVERELETSLTALITSPATNGDISSSSRYGRTRRLKTDSESTDTDKSMKQIKSPAIEKTPNKVQSPVYKMHASNSPVKAESTDTPKKLIASDSSIENQIENIYHENISLSRFGSDEKKSPGNKFPKVYVRKDLIQKREKEEEIDTIKSLFSPNQSYKSTNSHLNNVLERSSEKYNLTSKSHNGYLNTSSVVKTLDFDSSKKKKKDNRDSKGALSKSDLFDMEAKCEYQVGDLAWARMGTYPFWPCIVTREPNTDIFVKKKMFGRVERDVIHVTFFGDNGSRSWIVDTMLRKFLGQLEFEATRERFSPSAKKKDPKLYAAYFVSEKKMPLWSISVEEAETLLREPKRLRIDLLHDMLANTRTVKSASKARKSGKITRTASDVSLSESLYDTLFSEDDGKAEDPERSRSKSGKSLDVSDVVTACLDNMAAKTGITKIQRQSHMDRWLQKAKSKTPEKSQAKSTPQKTDKEVKVISTKRKKTSPIVPKQKPYSFRKSLNESQNAKHHLNEHDYTSKTTSTPKKSIQDSLSGTDKSKDEETSKTNEEIDTTCSEILNNTGSQESTSKNADLSPIISADDTVDEIQVNICSVEEHAELESCLNQNVESMEVNLDKSTPETNVSPKENLGVDSEELPKTSIDSINSAESNSATKPKESSQINSNTEESLDIQTLVNQSENKTKKKKEIEPMDVESENTSVEQSNDLTESIKNDDLNGTTTDPEQVSDKQVNKSQKRVRVVRHTRRSNIDADVLKHVHLDPSAQKVDSQLKTTDDHENEKLDVNIQTDVSLNDLDKSELEGPEKTNDESLPNKTRISRRLRNQIATDIPKDNEAELDKPDTSQQVVIDSPLNKVLPMTGELTNNTQNESNTEERGMDGLENVSALLETETLLKDTEATSKPKTTMSLRLNRKKNMRFSPELQKKNNPRKSLTKEIKIRKLTLEVPVEFEQAALNIESSQNDTDKHLNCSDLMSTSKTTPTLKSRSNKQRKSTQISLVAGTSDQIETKDHKIEDVNDSSLIESQKLEENLQEAITSETEKMDAKLSCFEITAHNALMSEPNKKQLKRNSRKKRLKSFEDKEPKKQKTCQPVEDSEKDSIELNSEKLENNQVPEEINKDGSVNKELAVQNQEVQIANNPVPNSKVRPKKSSRSKIDKTEFDEKMKSLQSVLDESQKELCFLLDSDVSFDYQETPEGIPEIERVDSENVKPTETTNIDFKTGSKKTVAFVDDKKVTAKKPRIKRQSKSPKIATNRMKEPTDAKPVKKSSRLKLKQDSKESIVADTEIPPDSGVKIDFDDQVKDLAEPQKEEETSQPLHERMEIDEVKKSATENLDKTMDEQQSEKVQEVVVAKRSSRIKLKQDRKELILADNEIPSGSGDSENQVEDLVETQKEEEHLQPPKERFKTAEVTSNSVHSLEKTFELEQQNKSTPEVVVAKKSVRLKLKRDSKQLTMADTEVPPDSGGQIESENQVKDLVGLQKEGKLQLTIERMEMDEVKSDSEKSLLKTMEHVQQSEIVQDVVAKKSLRLKLKKDRKELLPADTEIPPESHVQIASDKQVSGDLVEPQKEENNLELAIEPLEINEVKSDCDNLLEKAMGQRHEEQNEVVKKTIENDEQTEKVQIVVVDYPPKEILVTPIDEQIMDSDQVVPKLKENVLERMDHENNVQELQEQSISDNLKQTSLDHLNNKKEEEMEYGHLEFTDKRSGVNLEHPEVSIHIGHKENVQEQKKDNIVEQESEDKEYGHLDFIFSSCDNLLEKSKTETSVVVPNVKMNELTNTKDVVNSKPVESSEVVDNIDKSSNHVTDVKAKIMNSKVSKEVDLKKLTNDDTGKKDTTSILDKDLTNCHEKAQDLLGEKPASIKEINKDINKVNGHDCYGTDTMDDNEDELEEKLVFRDSFETISTEKDVTKVQESDRDNDDTMNAGNTCESSDKPMLRNGIVDSNNEDVAGSISEGNVTNEPAKDPKCNESVLCSTVQEVNNSNVSEKPDEVESVPMLDNCNNDNESSKENGTEQRTKIGTDLETNLKNRINNNEDKTKTDEVTDTNKTGMDVDEFVASVNRLPEPVKLNGFHIDECLDFSDGEFNAETSSINSEDSEPLSVTKSKLQIKTRNKARKALADAEFQKYLELRQDDLMDEHPELSQDEIVEYLYKTWQYEENAKSDIRKSDDIEQSGLVKGLNEDLRQKTIRNNFRESKKRNKKRDDDTVSINSDISDTSVRRRLRRKAAASPALSEDIDDNLSSEMNLEMKSDLLDNISINSDASYNSMKYTSPIDAKLTVTSTLEEKSISSITSNDEIVNKSDSVEKIKDKPENLKPSKSLKKESKPKSPKSKDGSIKNYFKVTSSEESKTTDVDKSADDTDIKIKEEYDPETTSITSVNSEDSEVSLSKRKPRKHGDKNKSMTDPEFLKYVELRQDALIDENPQLSQDEIMSYLYKTWLYEESVKSDIKKTDDLEQANLVKGLNEGQGTPQTKKVKRKVKVEKDALDTETSPKDKPKRKISQPYYNENISDIEDEIELFEIFKPKKKLNMLNPDGQEMKNDQGTNDLQQEVIELDEVDEVELYFAQLTQPKPNVFKGLVREKVCDICEKTENLIKCKGCNNMFHAECVKKAVEVVEEPALPTRGRKKKKKAGRRPKNTEESESHSDEKSQDVSEELNASIEDEILPCTVNADDFEALLAAKMKELLPTEANYDSFSSDECLNWNTLRPGQCEIVDVKIKPKIEIDYSNFKCNNCSVHSTPVCFVCKKAESKTGVEIRQKCQTAHCNKYYHLECLDHWPQTQFQSGEPSRSNKKISEHFEALMCPRHVCHTCVSDDPRGCKTRFSGDKLARCIRCPATYHTFTKCLPAGTQILTGSLIVCPRHYQHRPGKVPCHVNTGWCFICALGGSLICCEYCPTSFHAECLNIKPPEGGYMCEDCETGRLPLYGEMVWVKLGHYRWWPGIILHPSEIPENIMAVKHSPGEFVVRFFGQYDHYWVNRGRVFPFQEGDSGKVSSQKSKIDAAFTTAMEHAQRACEILKRAVPNEEESLDIASSLLPPHYVKLRVNKPCGSLCGRRVDVEESSLTQCDCDPADSDPCGPYSHCLNRMLLTECGPICRAGERCSNRAFEKRLYPRLAPYRTPHRGWGLKTLEDIKAGQFVIEYVGELIDEEEFRRRMCRMHEIRDENFYFLTLDKERMIDAGPKGNLARFMNHCCEPNCETQKWTVLGDVRVGLFALYDIPANSELTFNYNLECAGIEKKRCMCGARRCSGYIGAKPKQEETQSKKNKIPGKRTYKKRKNVEESPSTSKNKPKRPVGRPAKPRELTEIEKDLLIIKNATNGISSDSEGSGRLSSIDSERHPKALKRKRVSFSTEEVSKKAKVDETSREVGD